VGVDGEILAQHRQRASGARLLQERITALEEVDVGQHRQAGRAAGLVGAGDGRRVEVRADHAPGRARLLHLGDDRRLARGHPRLDRGGEAARRGHGSGQALEFAQRHPGAAFGDLFGLAPENALQHGHAGAPPNCRVVATNSSSFARAPPLAMAARARAMPSAIESATPEAYSAAPAFSATISSGRPGSPSNAPSNLARDSSGPATCRLRVCAMAMPKSSGCTSYSRTTPSRSSPTMVAAPSDSSSMPSR